MTPKASTILHILLFFFIIIVDLLISQIAMLSGSGGGPRSIPLSTSSANSSKPRQLVIRPFKTAPKLPDVSYNHYSFLFGSSMWDDLRVYNPQFLKNFLISNFSFHKAHKLMSLHFNLLTIDRTLKIKHGNISRPQLRPCSAKQQLWRKAKNNCTVM